jgi:hypothetical protein
VSTAPLRRISLAHLTVLDTTPPEPVTVAAAAGFRTAGIRLTAPPSVGIPPYELVAALPATAPLAVEEPCGATAHLPALERARRAQQALSVLLSAERSHDRA